jgi:SAM-dependent methyltransferase
MTLLSSIRRWAKLYALAPEPFYRAYLRWRCHARSPRQSPAAPWINSALQDREAALAAQEQSRRLGLPLHPSPEKNWDTLAALAVVLDHTQRSARILDAGAELYSQVLPSLYLLGYRDLWGVNLAFSKPFRHGPIQYEPGDITRTRFSDDFFDAITCLSVIEHGVDVEAFFREMSRILKPQGVLVVSADYHELPTETHGQEAYGAPVHVFDRREIEEALVIASRRDLHPTGDVQLECGGRPVRWAQMGLDFTFLVFALQKRGANRSADAGGSLLGTRTG